MARFSLFTPITAAALLAACWALPSACSNAVPDSSQFVTADGVSGADTGTLADAGPAVTDISAAGSEDATPIASDSAVVADGGPVDAGAPDAGPTDTAAKGATCYEALNCLLEKKQWRPGKPPPKDGTCMAGMVDEEAMQSDALVGCVQTACKAEFDAWDTAGATKLDQLFGCMIEKCTEPLATCVGGEGQKSCADAVKCLQACPPLDKTCTVPCMQPTSPYQSTKTGKLLACFFKTCTLATLATCAKDQNCAIAHCLELAG